MTATQLLARVSAARVERARAEAVMAERFAPSFNAVTLLAPGETRLSAVFRWLLDEAASHGQGGVFRDRFVTVLLGGAPEAWAGARVGCEVATMDGGRIDLLIESRDGTRCVVVENKPWAGWQTDQLARYLADQRGRRADVRIHALIGDADPAGALERHWASGTREPLPRSATASGFDEVAAWLESCAAASRADSVRRFLHDLAGYVRHSILSEPSMTDVHDTAKLILAGGAEALQAARAIAAALPLAMTREVAGRVSGSVDLVGSMHCLGVTVDGVRVHFALFGTTSPWGGVTDKGRVNELNGAINWARPESRWPRWSYLKAMGADGVELARVTALGDLERVAELVLPVARTMVGAPLIGAQGT